MADELAKMVTHKKVKETVDSLKETQTKALEAVKGLQEQAGSLMSGMQSIVSNAQNVISQTITGITGTLEQSVSKFSQQINAGLTTTLTDLSQKFGSAIGDITGKVNTGAIAGKLSFVADTLSASVNGMSLFGQDGSGVNGLLKNFSNGQLDKLISASGISNILNNSDLKSAINSVTNSISSVTSAAKSIVKDVVSLPSKVVSSVAATINDVTGGILKSVEKSVGQLVNVKGIGDVGSLVKDMFDIYSLGRGVYDLVSGKDMSSILGIASKFNNSFPEVQNLLNTASEICSTLSGNYIDNYSRNKDLMDLLLYRMSNQGMWGAINQLMNCSDTQRYVTDDTYIMLANRLVDRCNNGDVYTASALQQLVGNSRIANGRNSMYNLAYNMNDVEEDNVDEYMGMLNRMGISASELTGRNYTSNNGSSAYIYDSSTIEVLGGSSPNLVDALLGGNSTLRNMSNALVGLFG